jgi:hypothetical protein
MFPPAAAVVAKEFLNNGIPLTDRGIPAPSNELKHSMYWRTVLPCLNPTAPCARFHTHPDKFHTEILAHISNAQLFGKHRCYCERCNAIGYVRKLTDRVGHLLRLRLQINEAACHFFGLSYCYFQSFAAFGIPVCRRSYPVNSKRPVPHVAIFCRKYLDFSTFVFKARHGIQRWHRQNAYGQYIKCVPKRMLRCARRLASLVSSEVISNDPERTTTGRALPSPRHTGLQRGRQRFGQLRRVLKWDVA